MLIDTQTASHLLDKGEVVALPTDTIYGIGARLDRPEALRKLFELKKRPESNPIVTLLPNAASLQPFLSQEISSLRKLMTTFWPGALTLVVPIKKGSLPPEILGGGKTGGFRVPNSKEALSLLQLAGPLAVTSANLSKAPPATTYKEVEKTFGKDFPILEGHPPQGGVASTVLIFENGIWRVGREGAIPSFLISEKIKP